MYELDVEFTVQSRLVESNGMGLMLLKKQPVFPQEFGSALGYREDYNGIGVFLYKSQKRFPGKWVSDIWILYTFPIVHLGPLKQGNDSFR